MAQTVTKPIREHEIRTGDVLDLTGRQVLQVLAGPGDQYLTLVHSAVGSSTQLRRDALVRVRRRHVVEDQADDVAPEDSAGHVWFVGEVERRHSGYRRPEPTGNARQRRSQSRSGGGW